MELGPTTREQHNTVLDVNTRTEHLHGSNRRLGRISSEASPSHLLGREMAWGSHQVRAHRSWVAQGERR